ncbi:adenine nucleotide alpha hydrolases-like protein [Leucogyrophana mollusca]|uniref:Adenine nucleotide alpha hydrolases-like protein n=1 Tax=Leucogyrophana mollusca TaxID=85980 RepID=A0ACB8BUS2_9AGAM|nr:adenine nucleotide alpha hydrolases-like protein [Leucogyrophana mollusca]
MPFRAAAAPISRNEFFQMFMRCTPPTGWSPHSKLVVGNSGGPDSTCLLFLINRLLTGESTRTRTSKPLPPSVISMAVNHDLQAASTSMATRASTNASSMGVEHLTLHVPWSSPPFPPKPVAGEFVEHHARTARYHVLFGGLTRVGADTIALGHHADDQVETSLMRLARGTTELGAGGMRRCRRWGMGLTADEHALGYSGLEGMRRWIIRPFLEVRKDRILATCEENRLEYVNDPTNFQPGITLRNAIRQMLDQEESLSSDTTTVSPIDFGVLSPDIIRSLESIKTASAQLQSTVMDVSGGREQLRGAVKVLASRVEDIDAQVTTLIKKHTLPSPPSTFLLSTHSLSAIADPTVQSALVLRIMRYISCYPWGSVRADGNRRSASIRRIINNLWTRDPFATPLKPFTAGSGVLWSPAIFNAERPVRIGDQYLKCKLQPGDRFAWLASRLPLSAANKTQEVEFPSDVDIDITDRLVSAQRKMILGKNDGGILEVLFDCRFLLRFDLRQLPDSIMEVLKTRRLHLDRKALATVRILPFSRFCWPRVILRQSEHPDIELATLDSDGSCRHAEGSRPWIAMEWIRILDAI